MSSRPIALIVHVDAEERRKLTALAPTVGWACTEVATVAAADRALRRVALRAVVTSAVLGDGSAFDVARAVEAVTTSTHPRLPILVVADAVDPADMNRAHMIDVEYVSAADPAPNVCKFLRRCGALPGCAAQLAELVKSAGLTEAEAALVALGAESTAQEYLLARRHITKNTLKTQVRSLLAKTGAAHLEEVVRPLRRKVGW
jgi:DNA-binding CsgD family transcriptional regulator